MIGSIQRLASCPSFTASVQGLAQFNALPAAAVIGSGATYRSFHATQCCHRGHTARYLPTRDRSKPISYEMSQGPWKIGHSKSWNSWNTSNIIDGKRKEDSLVDDLFIRKFLVGTWHNLFISEIIIKRQYNMVRIAGVVQRKVLPRKMYFLIGYTEEMLSYWLKGPVKMEIQTTQDAKDIVYKYI